MDSQNEPPLLPPIPRRQNAVQVAGPDVKVIAVLEVRANARVIVVLKVRAIA